MTEEEVVVVNVGGEEIAENGEDHQKIKGDHCNGDAHAKEKNENGNVGDEVEVVADSGASDPIVTVDGNGSALEVRKVDGESIIVKVMEGARDSKVVENNNQENDYVVDASADGICKTTNFDVVERQGESGIIIDGQNGSGSAVVSLLENENDVHVFDNNTVAEGGDGFRTVQNGVLDSEIRDEIVVRASDAQNDVVAENEICDDVDADVDQSDRDWEVVAVENGVAETAEEVQIPDVPVVVDASESVDSNVQENHEKLESEEIVEKNEIPVDDNGVSDVKECADEDSKDGLEKVPVESVSEENGLPDDGENGGEVERSGEGSGHEVIPEGEKLSDKVVDGDVEASVDRREIEDDTAVENEAETSNGALKGEDEPSADDSDNRNDAVVFEAEPSNNVVESEAHPSVNEAEPSNYAVDSEARPSISETEPSKDAVQSEAPSVSEAEPSISNDAVQPEAPSVSEAEPSISDDAVHGEAEPSNNAVESPSVSEAEPSISDDAVHGEAEPSNNAVESEAHPSVNEVEFSISNDAVESEAHSSVSEAELSISNDVVQSKAEPSVSEAEPSNNAVLSEASPSVRDAEPSNDVVQNDTDLSVSETEPSMRDVQREVDLSVSEAGPSNDAVQTEADPSISEAEPSNDAVQSEAAPSISKAEPSNDAVQSEADPAVSEAEPSNNAAQSEGDLSVDAPELKTDAVSSEAEPLVEGESSNQADDDSITAQEGSAADTLDGQNTVTEVVKRPFYYLIRVPRYDDNENLKEQIKNALREVEEKTKIRDAIRGESQTKKATCKEYGQEVRAAIAEERAARDLLKAKRREMDSVQSTMNRLNNAISVGDIDSKIRNIEHMIQHETRPLKEEKQLLRQIQQLKQNRDGLSTIMAKHDQSQSLDDKVSIEEKSKQLQLLKKELDMLRNNVQKTDAVTKAAKKKYDEECSQLNEVLARFKEADDTRQEAFVKLHTLKKQLHEKSKYFWEYRNAATKGQELAAQGKREELQSFCIDQAERIMKMWNNNDEFRRDYTRCNTRSTLRRLQTLDGRSLGPDEEPPVIPNAFTERAPKIDSLVSQSTPEQEKKTISTDSVNKKDEPVSKVVVQVTEKSQTAKVKKPAKPAALQKSVVPVTRWGDEPDEDTKDEPVRTKEEEERILKAEKARKEEEEAKLKEIRRLEEIEKAKEALQRKKRNAEKAQQRAAYKAQKEAEQREKEREKRAKKKEKRKTVTSDDVVDNNTEQESATSTEILTRAAEESDQNEKPVEVTKRPQKPSQFMKQNKVKSLPMSIRNRGKRRIQPWMWILIAVLAVVALFYMGNNSSLRSSLRSFGF